MSLLPLLHPLPHFYHLASHLSHLSHTYNHAPLTGITSPTLFTAHHPYHTSHPYHLSHPFHDTPPYHTTHPYHLSHPFHNTPPLYFPSLSTLPPFSQHTTVPYHPSLSPLPLFSQHTTLILPILINSPTLFTTHHRTIPPILITSTTLFTTHHPYHLSHPYYLLPPTHFYYPHPTPKDHQESDEPCMQCCIWLMNDQDFYYLICIGTPTPQWPTARCIHASQLSWRYVAQSWFHHGLYMWVAVSVNGCCADDSVWFTGP